LVSKNELLSAERTVAALRSDIATIEGQMEVAEASAVEAQQRLQSLLAGHREARGDELATTLIELDDIMQRIDAVLLRLAEGSIAAPMSGILNQLLAHRPGTIVAPGESLAELVPSDAELIAEIQIAPSEIGHIRPGHITRIAVDGLEPHRYGYVDGRVLRLSSFTFVDDKGTPFFRGQVALQQRTTGRDSRVVNLIPGMTLSAQIVTGEHTILAYLLKPLHHAWMTAFREK
jgi:HlyD family secretion protein/adhesin transport system membrane fusion protein